MPYYLFDGKQAVGPFEPADLIKRAGFDARTLVFPHGAKSADAWKAAGAFPDIVEALAAVIPPPPPHVIVPGAGLTLQAPPPAEPTAQAPDPEPVAVPVETGPKLPAPSEKLILVVDDDEDVRSFIEMSATMDGFQVVTAVNGIDAGQKLSQREPDLIVTDLMMPGQGGYEFLRSLQGSSTGRIPIFVVTGSSLDNSTIAMIRQEANVVEFVNKPININKFLGDLHKHLGTERPSPRAAEKRDSAF
jgi:CheY-like chemotaxis protein